MRHQNYPAGCQQRGDYEKTFHNIPFLSADNAVIGLCCQRINNSIQRRKHQEAAGSTENKQLRVQHVHNRQDFRNHRQGKNDMNPRSNQRQEKHDKNLRMDGLFDFRPAHTHLLHNLEPFFIVVAL